MSEVPIPPQRETAAVQIPRKTLSQNRAKLITNFREWATSLFTRKTNERGEFTATRQQEMEAVKNGKFDAVVALGGGYRMQKGTDGSVQYLLSSYNPDNATYPYLITGVKARAIAEEELIARNPDATIIALSRNKPVTQLSDAEALLSYEERNHPQLKARIESAENMIDDPISNSTVTEIMELIDLAVTNNKRHIALTTNDWQLLRARKMYEMFRDNPEKMRGMLRASVSKESNTEDVVDKVLNQFEQRRAQFFAEGRSIEFISSEAALEVRRPGLYKEIIIKAQSPRKPMHVTNEQLDKMKEAGYKFRIIPQKYDTAPEEGKILIQTDAFANRLHGEKRGIQQLEDGIYRAGNGFAVYCQRKLEMLTQ